LIDKLKHEQEMKELQSEMKTMKHEMTSKIDNLTEMLARVLPLIPKATSGTQNMTMTGDHNTQNQININNYDAPDLTDLKLSLEHLRQKEKIMFTMIKAIFLNPSKPENHSIILKNRKDKIWSIYENEWKLLSTDREREDLRRHLSNTAHRVGCDELNKLYDGEEGFKELRPSDQKRLYEFNGGDPSEASLTEKEMTGLFMKIR
jgi:hypothetical protein